MKLTGEEKVGLCTEKDGKSCFTISDITFNDLLNDFMVKRMLERLKVRGDNEKLTTSYLIIDNEKYLSNAIVSVKFDVSYKEYIPIISDFTSRIKHDRLKIKDFFNFIVETIDMSAYEFDTEIDNINLEIKEFEVVDINDYTETEEELKWTIALRI